MRFCRLTGLRFNQQGYEETRPILEQLARHHIPSASGQQETSFRKVLKETAPEEQRELLLHFVQGEVIKVLGLNASEIPNLRQGLSDIGMDSLMAVELSNRLQKALEHALPSTLTFEYPTIEALTNYLASDILALTPASNAALAAKNHSNPQSIINEVENIPEDQLEEELLKELKDLGY